MVDRAVLPRAGSTQLTRSAPTLLWQEIAMVLFCAIVFIFLRLPLYTQPGILFGWNSDAALLGLMARSMVAGDVPLLFWGCDYLWPLTSLFAAIVGKFFLHDVGPLALRLGVTIEVFAALIFFHAALRRIVGRRASLLAMFWLTAGPSFLFKLTYAPLSAEQYFFAGAVAFWYVARRRFTRVHHFFVLGLLTGLGWWIHRGVMFVVVPSLVVILWYDRGWLRRSELVIGAAMFAAGTALGYLPVVFGRLAIDQRLYTPVTPPWSVEHVLRRISETFTEDLWKLLGADTFPLQIAFATAILVLLTIAAMHLERSRETMLAIGIVAISFAFWIFSTQAHRGAVRYIMIALPIVYAFAAQGLVWLWERNHRFGGALLALIITTSLFIGRIADASAVVAGQREPFENWGGFDPRPALRNVALGGYSVCYADVWVAHKLEWLSPTRVRFIPYRSVNRRMVDSLRLAAAPGRKCFVDHSGNVRALSAREEVEFRLDTLRLAKGRIAKAELK